MRGESLNGVEETKKELGYIILKDKTAVDKHNKAIMKEYSKKEQAIQKSKFAFEQKYPQYFGDKAISAPDDIQTKWENFDEQLKANEKWLADNTAYTPEWIAKRKERLAKETRKYKTPDDPLEEVKTMPGEIIGEEETHKEPWEMTEKERMNISLPLKVPGEDTVYIFRKTDKAEVDNILNGGQSGQFWASKQAFPGKYVLIAKSNKRNISWEFNISHQKELLHWKKGKAVWSANPKFIESATIYNNHFQEVGERRTLKDIIVIVDEKGNIIYLQKKKKLEEIIR